MGKSSSVRKVPRGKVRGSRRRLNVGYGAFMTVIIVIGILAIVLSREESQEAAANRPGPPIGVHWHAALGVNVCGEWKANTPAYDVPTGIHSHGDGFIHMHPLSSAGAYERATVGLYLDQVPGDEIEVTSEGIRLGDGTDVSNGDECPNISQEPAGIRWSINGSEQPFDSDPTEHVPADGEVIAIAFLPKDEPIGRPPVAGETPSDVSAPPNGASTTPTGPSGTETTSTGGGGDTTTTTPE